MAASVVYTVWDGQIISENRGGVESDYIPDPLGNTIALINDSQSITDTWVYWPYGEVQNHGGSPGNSITPFTFLGTLGYFVDFVNLIYVRARFLRPDLTQWLTLDELWSKTSGYRYCDEEPTLLTDPLGRVPIPPQVIAILNKIGGFVTLALMIVCIINMLWDEIHHSPPDAITNDCVNCCMIAPAIYGAVLGLIVGSAADGIGGIVLGTLLMVGGLLAGQKLCDCLCKPKSCSLPIGDCPLFGPDFPTSDQTWPGMTTGHGSKIRSG